MTNIDEIEGYLNLHNFFYKFNILNEHKPFLLIHRYIFYQVKGH